MKIWTKKAGNDARHLSASSRETSAIELKGREKAEFSKELERLRALNRDVLAALPADRKADAERAVSADADKIGESVATGKATGDARLDSLAEAARERGIVDGQALVDMAASSYLLTNREDLLSCVPESSRARLASKFAELESAARSSGVAFSGSADRVLEASKSRDRELVTLGNTSFSDEAVRVGDRVRIADQTFDLSAEPPRKFIEGKGLRIETTAPYQSRFETRSRIAELHAEKASLDATVGKSLATAEGLAGSFLGRKVELDRADPGRYRSQAEALRNDLRRVVEGHYRGGELCHPLDEAAARRLLDTVSPETVDRTAEAMERSAEAARELSRIGGEESDREGEFRRESEKRDAAARANRDYLLELGADGL